MNLYVDDDSAKAKLITFLRQVGNRVLVPAECGTIGTSEARHFEYATRNGLVLLTQSVDDGTLDDAVSILRLYLWSARENPAFAEIRVQHKLPLAAPVKELVESLGFSDDM